MGQKSRPLLSGNPETLKTAKQLTKREFGWATDWLEAIQEISEQLTPNANRDK